MAKGRAIGQFEAMLGVVGLLALGVAYGVATGWNPLPRLPGWLDRAPALAAPAAPRAVTSRDLVVGVACPRSGACTLTARAPEGGGVGWRPSLTGDVQGVSGVTHALAGLRPLGRGVGVPAPVPPLLGFPVDDRVQVVDSRNGSRLTAYRSTSLTWATVAGSRVVITGRDKKKGPCRPPTDGRDPAGDRAVWDLDGYDLHTGTPLGCDQRNGPAGAGGVVVRDSPVGH